jgi:alpha-glucosidase
MTWWSASCFYEIYVRSFQDTNGDGVGDLNGVTSRLPYLQDLGVDALWITPFYPSPQVDFGYDVSDHEAVDPLFGTLADFDRLLAAAHRRGIRVVIDIVLNHTSDRHCWFEESRAFRGSARRDWFVWRDGRGGGPPTNWESAFGGPAWTLDPRTGQWYYHCFYPEQPDLNWRNPEVEQRMLDVLGFWLDRGVDGFRLDAVNTLFEDVALRDNPLLDEPRLTLTGVDSQRPVYTRGLPELHDTLRRIRAFVERRQRDAILISEAYVGSAEQLTAFYGADDEMHLPFNFFLAQVPGRDADAMRDAVEKVERACDGRWPSLVLSNHDIDRACDRFAGGEDPDGVARLLATLLLTLRGTPFIYYGEEIAMRTDPPESIDEVRDPVGRRFWPGYKGRDGVRRPMQWGSARAAGFTSGTPWLRLSRDSAERNVERQRAEPASVLNFYRSLLRLRRTTPALLSGGFETVASSRGLLAYARTAGDQRVIVALNFTGERQELTVSQLTPGATVLVGSHRPTGERVDARPLRLRPLESVVLQP